MRKRIRLENDRQPQNNHRPITPEAQTSKPSEFHPQNTEGVSSSHADSSQASINEGIVTVRKISFKFIFMSTET